MSTGNQNPEGMVLGGRYRISRLIGSGGMANVYLATDITNDSPVAIKILKLEYSADMEFIQRFDTEARAVASLTHPNIVRVYGVGQEGQFRYMVQEFVDGITVKELIRQNGYLDWRIAVPIVIQVCMALSHAHENGIVHRDIKPHNILITRDRIAKVTDFGIARAATSNTITFASGGAMGSVHYFSPEQARGAIVGPSSDIYSTGILLFEMLTGQVPFDGETPVAIAVKHLQDTPPHAGQLVPSIPEGLDNIIQKCMQKDPEYRYPSIRALVEELDAFMVDPDGMYGLVHLKQKMEDATMQVHGFRQEPNYDKLSEIEHSIKSRRHSKIKDNALIVVVVCVVLAVVIGAGYLLMQLFQGETPTEEEDFLVQDYSGRNYEDVLAEFERQNFTNYRLAWQDSEEEPNRVIDQNPKAGVRLKRDSELSVLTLTVSRAADSVVVPDIIGQPIEEARTMLRELGFDIVETAQDSDVYDLGQVISTTPENGTAVKPGTQIRVFVSDSRIFTLENYVGMQLEAAEALFQEKEFTNYTVEQEESETEPPNKVLRQSVQAGGKVKYEGEGNKLVLTVSKEKTTVPVPDVAGLAMAEARTSLEALGLTVSEATETSNTVESGHVIRTDPPQGTQIDKNATITVYVAQAPNRNVVVPELAGQTYAEAMDTLRALGLDPHATSTPGIPVSDLVVLYIENYSAGQTVITGTSIRFVCGSREEYNNQINNPQPDFENTSVLFQWFNSVSE